MLVVIRVLDILKIVNEGKVTTFKRVTIDLIQIIGTILDNKEIILSGIVIRAISQFGSKMIYVINVV